MARITIEDCLKKIPSRFELVHLAAQRVRQIREGSEYLVSSPKNEDIVVALREIAAGKITKDNVETPQDMFFNNMIETATDQDTEQVQAADDTGETPEVPEDDSSDDLAEDASYEADEASDEDTDETGE